MQFSVDAVMADEVDHQDAVVADQVDLAVLMSEEARPDILEVMEHHHKLQNHKDGIWLEVVYKYESYVKEITLFKGFKTFASM